MSVRRPALIALGIAGAVLIAIPLVFGMFGKSRAIESLVDSFGPNYQPQRHAQITQDFATVSAMANQLRGEALPALARRAGATPAQMQASLARDAPDVARGLQGLPEAQAWLGDLKARIDRVEPHYKLAKDVPMPFLPASATPWLLVVPGMVLLLAAGLGLVRPSMTRGALIAGGVAGLVLLVAPVAGNIPAKASAINGVRDELRPKLQPQAAKRTETYVTQLSAMATGFSQQALPALARQLDVSPQHLRAQIATDFPAVGRGMQQLPAILPRFNGLTQTISANVVNFHKADRLPWKGGSASLLVWFLVIPGALAFVGAAVGLVAGRRVANAAQPARRLAV